jgi:hypothetical protein
MKLASAALISILALASSARAGEPDVQKRFWLTWHETAERRVQYEVTVMINGSWAATISSGEAGKPIDVTPFVHAGENSALFLVNKNTAGARLSESERDAMTIQLTKELFVEDQQVLRDLIIEVGHTAAETDAFLT